MMISFAQHKSSLGEHRALIQVNLQNSHLSDDCSSGRRLVAAQVDVQEQAT
jgi:hypothetical protein